MFLVLLLYMLFASTFTMGKAALAYTTPIFFIAIRMFIGGMLLLTYQYFFKHKNWSFHWKDIGLLAQVSFFQYYAAFIFEFWALQWVTSSKACLLFNLSPFITALISFFLLQEYLTIKKVLGLIIGFLGFMPILMTTTPQEQLAGSILWLSMPELSLLGAVFCASYGWIMLKKAQNRGYHTVTINGLTMTAAGVAAFVTSLIVEGLPVIVPPKACLGASLPWLCELVTPYGAGIILFVGYTFALIIIANVIAFNLYGYLLSLYSTTFISFAGFVTPLFAALFGWIFLGETIGWQFILSMVIVFWGLLLFYQEEFKSSSNIG